MGVVIRVMSAVQLWLPPRGRLLREQGTACGDVWLVCCTRTRRRPSMRVLLLHTYHALLEVCTAGSVGMCRRRTRLLGGAILCSVLRRV